MRYFTLDFYFKVNNGRIEPYIGIFMCRECNIDTNLPFAHLKFEHALSWRTDERGVMRMREKRRVLS